MRETRYSKLVNTLSAIKSVSTSPTRSLPAATTTQVALDPVDSYNPVSQDEIPPMLKRALEVAGTPYLDEVRDRKDVAAYYGKVDLEASPTEVYQQLNQLVSRTHRERFSFDPEKRLFPWVDLRPSMRLQSIYSPQTVTTDSPVQRTKDKDFIVKMKVPTPGRVQKDGSIGPTRMVDRKVDLRSQAKEWGEALLAGPTNALAIAQRIAAVEGKRFYNGEHSVPQFFFDKAKVPKGDLHHLFACERESNSRRGCRPYSDVEKLPENRSLDGWAPRQLNQFEPDAGKGAVARATLYFLVRYPGMIGDKENEYTQQDLETLKRWHAEDPVGLYEKHRNQAIFDSQGNRNPFIDHPNWVDKVDFLQAFGAYGKTAENVPVGRPI